MARGAARSLIEGSDAGWGLAGARWLSLGRAASMEAGSV
jgi:hypothetical protein